MNLLLLYGGQSYEHDISLISAAYILQKLQASEYNIHLVAVRKDGSWQYCDMKAQASHAKKHNSLYISDELHTEDETWCIPAKGIWKNLKAPERIPIDCVLPIIHGYGGENGFIQATLEQANLPYIGCDSISSTISMQKHITKDILRQAAIPVTPSYTLHAVQYELQKEYYLAECEKTISYPMIVKPSDGGSSLGIASAKNYDELEKAINAAFPFSNVLIIEPLLHNIREIETSVLIVDGEARSFPPGEIIIPDKKIYDYNLKYISSTTHAEIPASLNLEIAKKIRELSIQVFTVLACDGFARIDFFLEENENIFVNEINTIPGFTSISMFPQIIEQELPADKMLKHVISRAIISYNERDSKRNH